MPPLSRPRADAIAIALASDNNYVRYLATAMASVLATAAPADDFDFYILDAGITDENKAKLEKLQKIKKFNIRYLTVDAAQFKDCPPLASGAHTNVVTYYRFLLGDLLPELNKILYLDTDIVAAQSLGALWQTDLTGCYAAAVADEWEYIKTYKPQMSFAVDEFYFNAGVILLNLEKWRQDGITQKLFVNRLRLNELKVFACGDQDALNYTFQGKTRPLHWGYNVQQSTFWQRDAEAQTKRGDVYLIHYNGPQKPDTADCQHAFCEDFWRYYALTEFYVPPERRPQPPPKWLKNVWVYHNRKDEVLLRVLKINLLKIERKDHFSIKLLGLPLFRSVSRDGRRRVKVLGIPLS